MTKKADGAPLTGYGLRAVTKRQSARWDSRRALRVSRSARSWLAYHTTAALILLLCALPCAAEQTPAWAPSQRATAAAISNAALGTQIGLDTLHSFRSPHRKSAFLEQGCAIGLALGIDEMLKHSAGRLRPDGSDNRSFPSGHTSLAAASGGWRFAFSAPITELVAVARMGAGKHFPTDTLAGAGIGTVSRLIAQQWCR